MRNPYRYHVEIPGCKRQTFKTEQEARNYAIWQSEYTRGKIIVWQQDKTTKYMDIIGYYSAGVPTPPYRTITT